MNLSINLSKTALGIATDTWNNARKVQETSAETVEAYLESLLTGELQDTLDARVAEVVRSWTPPETEEVKQKRDELAGKLADVPAEKLAQIEAIMSAEDSI